MNRLDSLYSDAESAQQYSINYAKYLGEVLTNLDHSAVAEFIETLLRARERGSQIFFIGNGGSAATSSHFANDLLAGMRVAHKPFKAIALTDNNAILTALGNDEGYEFIFVKQLEALLNPGDVVVAISASGNSPNLLRAIDYANGRDAYTVGLVGFDGGAMLKSCRHSILVQTAKGEYGPVEDVHMILDHLVTTYIYRAIRETRSRSVADAVEQRGV